MICPVGHLHCAVVFRAESAKLCSYGKIFKYYSCNVFSLAFCENCQHQILSTVLLLQMTLTRPTKGG